MQRKRSQTISVFPAHTTLAAASPLPTSAFETLEPIAAPSASTPPAPEWSFPSYSGSLLSAHEPVVLPSSHLIHLAPADSSSFCFLSDFVEEPSRPIVFEPPLALYPQHQREDSLASKFEYVFGGPLNLLHSHHKSRTSAQLDSQHRDEDDADHRLHKLNSVASAPLTALNSCVFAMTLTEPTQHAYPRYHGSAKKRKTPLRHRIFSRRSKFVFISSLVPFVSFVVVFLVALTTRVTYTYSPRAKPAYESVKDGFSFYLVDPHYREDQQNYDYELEYTILPPRKLYNLSSPVVATLGVLLKPRNPADRSYEERRSPANRYTDKFLSLKQIGFSLNVLDLFAAHPFQPSDPFFAYDSRLANATYTIESTVLDEAILNEGGCTDTNMCIRI